MVLIIIGHGFSVGDKGCYVLLITQIYSGITHGRVLDGELYAQRREG